MIAPLREPRADLGNTAMREARRLAVRLLPASSDRPQARQIAAWKAWMFACWTVIGAAAYFWSMLLKK